MMKNTICLLITQLISLLSFAQGVSINESGNSPDPSSALDISIQQKGLLIPRMSTSDRNAISSPADVLMIFNTTSRCFETYSAVSATWVTTNCLDCQLPGAFSATSASGILMTEFVANWTTSGAASDYYLDVSTDPTFSSFVSGYQDLAVGNVNQYTVTGLTCGTNYYYRLRAGNNCGNGPLGNTITVSTSSCNYCPQASFTDSRNGKTYYTVLIQGNSSPYCGGSSQCWMRENLDIGTFIPKSTGQSSGGDNQNGSIQKYCYNDDPANCTIYGGLYQWNEAMAYGTSVSGNGPGPRGICPVGWHIPTDNEWKCLEMNLGMTSSTADGTSWRGSTEGGQLKQSGTQLWTTPNTSATNSTGFTALPGGYLGTDAAFANIQNNSAMWSATQGTSTNSYDRLFRFSDGLIARFNDGKSAAMSIRCVKD